MTTRVFLARHGQTAWNVERRFQGFSDNDLNETGHEQARLLAQALRDEPIAAVYASTLRRAIQTAEAIARAHALPVWTDPDLRELNQGHLEGQTAAVLAEQYPDLQAQWREQPARLRLPGGESMEELQTRAWGALQRIVARHPTESVAVVAHNLANIAILCMVTGCSLDQFRQLKQDSACVSLIEWRDGAPQIRVLNDTSHLQQLASQAWSPGS